jgi:hypothetical protein
MSFGKTGLDAWGYADVMQSALSKNANRSLEIVEHVMLFSLKRPT